ncbi:MAG: hypothetical protein ABI830_02765 [Pseudolabrys sp.]
MRVAAIQVGSILVALTCAIAAPCAAQDATPNDAALEAYASAPAENAEPAATPLPGDADLIGNALTFDPSTSAKFAPDKKLKSRSVTIDPRFEIDTTVKPDGSGTMVLKQPLPYDAKIGADLGLAANPQDFRPDRPLPGSRAERNSGAAWASVGVVPDFASVDARVDPSNDQGKIGTTFKHAMQLGGNYSVTLRNSYSVTGTFGTQPAGPADLPLMMPPPATAATPQVWGTERAAKFDILSTGTSFGAKFASTSIDPITHNTLSAEQKLYRGLNVTTALTDAGQPTASKSISAGYKLKW